MIKLLITGGTGFFGRSILRYLKSKYTNNNLTVSVFRVLQKFSQEISDF